MRLSVTSLALTAALASGCAAPLSSTFLSGSRQQDSVVEAHDGEESGPRAAAVRKATGEQPVSHEQAFAQVLDELQEIHAIDPQAEAELMADLKAAKPEHYPHIVSAFRTALAYRQQLASRDHRSLSHDDDVLIASDDSFARLVSHESPAPERDSAERAAMVQASLEAARAAKRQRSAAEADNPAPIPRDRTAVTPVVSQGPQEGLPHAGAVALGPAPSQHTLTSVELTPEKVETAAAHATQPVLANTSPGDWQTELARSIAELERTVVPNPTSVAELHDHMRLRTLQLLAGREEQAYRPIPGASADQQDYWSKQLFAISAYLDAGGKLDDKQRAAAALSALDDARAKLAELATLQIRNAAFVTSVDGFGAYTPVKATKFQPAQSVTLYAEVENFRSNSTEDGYHTSLATSYQVLDKTGRRVEGRQFPDVVDKCRNRRRDFHMQYQFPLPTRIYPGEYDLQLTITDHNSGKIGQTTLPFEIAGDQR
jgi:murein L,D-transpeptidase YcbB/YkuD